MDPQTFMDIATVITKLKMYPYFDIAHNVLVCMAVREDIPQVVAGAPSFTRKHPLSCWLACLLTSFAGSLIANLLLGEPVITPFKDHRAILTFSIIWYLIFYSPFDLAYKLAKFLPVKILIAMLKEVQRAHKVYHGVFHTAKLYPNAYLVIILIGTIKGSGAGLMKNFERLIRGLWIPGTNEILQPSFVTKECCVAATIFLLERLNYIAVPHPLIYFGIVLFFVYFKLSSIILGMVDPFAPLENLFCAVFLGGWWDAMRKAVEEPRKEETAQDKRNDILKTKDEKKKD